MNMTIRSRLPLSRRQLLRSAGTAAAAVALSARTRAQGAAVAPPSTITNPPRDFGPNAPPSTYFLDPDIVVADPAFNDLLQPNAPITRLWTGSLWAEGPAWCGQGRYLVFSDIPNNRQLRFLDEESRVTVFRYPANNSNGNTFDFQGRQISCEHLTRRVVRYEHDGSITVLADMSSRDIEGENLLYLPQAKIYDRSCSLGPWIVVGESEAAIRSWTIDLDIQRNGASAFHGRTSVSQIKRSFDSLGEFLFRSQSFARGAVLLTGTGVVPPDSFTLQPGDVVNIEISGIGTLSNSVVVV